MCLTYACACHCEQSLYLCQSLKGHLITVTLTPEKDKKQNK